MKRPAILAATHIVALAIGFAAGIYVLPILTSPPAPSSQAVIESSRDAQFTGEFRRGLAGSDALHWGEGKVSVGPRVISLAGRISPGPDYKLYLVSGFVQTEEAFARVKATSVRVGDIRTFENFIVPVPDGVDVARYDTVLVWCEAFSQFITAAKYR